MLPTETFVDAVSFLGYYDLGGLKLASKLCTGVANRCADAIHLFNFGDFSFHIHYGYINAYRRDSDGIMRWVCELYENGDEDLAEFVSEAFRNCSVGQIYLRTNHEYVLDAIKLAARTVVVADMYITVVSFENEKELCEFVDSFRRVKGLTVWPPHRPWRLSEKETLENFCQRKNIALDVVER